MSKHLASLAKGRWISDDHPDSVQPLARVSSKIKPPSIITKIVGVPVVTVAGILAFPVALSYLLFELVFPSKSMKAKVQQQASKTAQGVTKMRDIIYKSNLGPDNLAYIFLPFHARCVHGFFSLFPWFFGKFFEYSVIRIGNLFVRTEIGDELIRRFVLKQNGKQVIALGAGYDTRPYRIECLKGKKENVKYYEVDIMSTQQSKLKVLKDFSIDSAHVTFVPVDFSIETFTQCLLQVGWKQDEPSLFLWEGCSMYLPEEAVFETLRAVAKCPKGTYLYLDVFEDLFSEEGKKRMHLYPKIEKLIEYVKARGEPFQWGLLDTSRAGMEKFFSQFGLEVVEHVSPKEFERYFMEREDGVLAGSFSGIATYVIVRVV